MRVFNIDITRKGISPVVQVTEHDAMSRFFTLVLRDGAADYEEPEGATYSVWYKTADSHGWYDTITEPDNGTHPAVVADGNEYTIEIAEQATTSCGELALCITAPDGYQLTVSGIITRSDDIPGYDGQEVENYYNVYITEMRENAARAENAADIAVAYGATVEVDEDAQQLNITHHSGTEGGVGWLFGSAVTSSASGDPATFSDGANDVAVKSLVATINPVQSGSGDPSPSNIRPISGRTGLTVTREGKNILNPSAMVRGSVFVDNGNGTYTFSKVGTGASGRITWSSPIKADVGTTVTFSANITGTHESEIYVGFTLDESTGGASAECTVSNGRITGTVTSTGYMNGIRLYWRNNSTGVGTDSVVLSNMQVEYGSTATTYEPYAPTTYPISWQTEAGTIYGGTLNVTTGVLTVEYGKYTIPSDIAVTDRITSQNRVYWSFTDMANGVYLTDARTVCNRLPKSAPTNSPTMPCICIGSMSDSSYVYVQGVTLISGVTDLATLRTWLANNPVEFTYKLATPLDPIQLSPTEIKTLLGGNTIYTDAGSVSVDYIADTKLYIDNKVAELQALILEN